LDKINWCLKVKNGIELIEPNENLAKGYVLKAEEALEESRIAKSRDWRISAAYYAMYFSLYSVLMRLGIKCEIHSCTIEFAKRFLHDFLNQQDLDILEDAFQARNDSQYYVDKEVNKEIYEEIIKNAAGFLIKCKNIKPNPDIIKAIRTDLSKRKK